MTVNILGTDYEIVVKKYEEDKTFEKNSFVGYCSEFEKQIVICDMKTHPDWQNDTEKAMQASQKETLRHEIVHAFFNESGLSYSSNVFNGAWAKNEELVDWIALQGIKIYKAWLEVGAI